MHVKSKAVSITTCGNWVTNMVFGYYTPVRDSLLTSNDVICGMPFLLSNDTADKREFCRLQMWLAAFGPSGLFCIFAAFGVICYVFVLRYGLRQALFSKVCCDDLSLAGVPAKCY